MIGVLVLVVPLSGCTRELRSDGPLLAGGGHGSLCVPGALGQDVGIGEWLTLPASEPAVRIESVSLIDATGLTAPEFFVTPIPESTSLGTFYPEWETTDPEWLGVDVWQQRERAVGYEVQPGHSVELILVSAREEAEGSATRFEVEYSAEGWRYIARTTAEIQILEACF